ncbi:hypothetical protein [Tsukamurella hominis]
METTNSTRRPAAEVATRPAGVHWTPAHAVAAPATGPGGSQ